MFKVKYNIGKMDDDILNAIENPRDIKGIDLPLANTLFPTRLEIMPTDWECVEEPKKISS